MCYKNKLRKFFVNEFPRLLLVTGKNKNNYTSVLLKGGKNRMDYYNNVLYCLMRLSILYLILASIPIEQ